MTRDVELGYVSPQAAGSGTGAHRAEPLLVPFEGVAPRVAASAWLAPGVVLTGDVEVHEGANLWFGVVARGDVEPIVIGRDANVQDGAILHTDPGFPLVIGAEAAVGHGAIVHGCTLGEGCLVGMGATVLSGAVVGAGALVAAGAVVREGDAIPPRSLAVGVPARVVRVLDEDAGRAPAARYLARVPAYRMELRG